MCLYARDMNINRKNEKKYVEIKKIDFLGKKAVNFFFPSPNVL